MTFPAAIEGMRDMSGAEGLDRKATHSGCLMPYGMTSRNLRQWWFRETLFLPKIIAPLLCLLIAPAAGASSWAMPSVNGPLTIDGLVDEGIWRQATVLPMQINSYGQAFPQGGETRALVRGQYLCLSAKLPEFGRVVARSTGENPDWWREDLIIWTVHFGAFGKTLTISINPLGAYRVDASPLPRNWSDRPLSESVLGPGYFSTGLMEARRFFHNLTEPLLVSAAVGKNEWSVELAIPISDISNVGFLSAERVRVPRPNAPELRWYWPGPAPGLAFRLPPGDPSVAPPGLVRKIWVSPAVNAVSISSASDAVSDQLASLPHNVWNASERKTLGVDQMWEKSLAVRVQGAALAESRAWENVHSLADWQKFRDPRIVALKASLGTFPERTALHTSVTRRLEYGDGFVLENLIYESRPGLVVTANLYLPANIQGHIPAIVVVHSQHAPKVQMELQDLGMTSARAGTAVLIMDQLGAGERLQSQPWTRESYYSRYAMGEQLYLAGESLMKWMVWDIDRGVDTLLERPYIDPKRIVLLGAVAGGGDPAAVTAALDDRVAAVIPFNFGEASPEDHFTSGPRTYGSEVADPGWGEWESTRCLRLSIADQFFPWLINASVAPRGFIFSFELGWPNGVENEPIWKRYEKVFELSGQQDHLNQVDGFGPFPGPGEVENVGLQHRVKLYPILNRWLDIPIPETQYHNPRPEADLMALTPKAAAERKPKSVSVLAFEIAQTHLARARASRTSLSSSDRLRSLRTSLKEKLGDIDPAPDTRERTIWTKQLSSFSVEAVSLDTAPGISVPLFLIKPNSASAKRMPVVVAFAQGGKEAFLTQRRSDISALLDKGVAVCLVDVRGTGETAPSNNSVSGLENSSTSLAATELMLGTTALGQRLKDARTVVHYLMSRDDIDSKQLLLWGDSFVATNPREGLLDQSVGQQAGPQIIHQSDPLGSLLVLLTALYEDNVRAVAARGGLVSYLSVLEDRFCYVPQDVIIPGILETADISDIVATLAPRAVLLEGFVDGRNRQLTEFELNLQLRPSFGTAQSIPSRLIVRESSAPAGLATWLDGQLSR
jgi:cephalosporin-C deacetylase-like acetyl esterase